MTPSSDYIKPFPSSSNPFSSGTTTPIQSAGATPIRKSSFSDLKAGYGVSNVWRSGGSARSFCDSNYTPSEPGSQYESNAATVIDLPMDNDSKIGLVLETLNPEGKGKGQETTVTVTEIPRPGTKEAPLQPRERINYLAGLTAICAIIVSVDHFCSTFAPAVVMPGAPQHYASEGWANKIVTPFLLNQIWVGVFFTCSTRFLVSRYLRDGKLLGIAEKVVSRNFRGKSFNLIPTSVAFSFRFLR